MRVLESYRRLLRDPAGPRALGFGSLLLASTICVPLLGQLVIQGWASMALRRAALTGDAAPAVPSLAADLTYLGRLIGPGFRIMLAQFLWSLPLLLVVGAPMAVLGMWALVADSAAVTGAALALGGLGAVGLAVTAPVVLGAVTLRVGLTDRLDAALDVAGTWEVIRLTFAPTALTWLGITVTSTLLAFVGLIPCGLGVLPASVASLYVMALGHHHQYTVYLARGGAPLAVAPLEAGAYDTP